MGLPSLFDSNRVSIVTSQVDRLTAVDDELAEIRNQRKELRGRYNVLMRRREKIIADMPEHLRPRRGRPRK